MPCASVTSPKESIDEFITTAHVIHKSLNMSPPYFLVKRLYLFCVAGFLCPRYPLQVLCVSEAIFPTETVKGILFPHMEHLN